MKHDEVERLLHRGDASAAEALARKAVTADPKDALAHHLLGNALLLQQHPKEAEVCFRRAIALDPAAYKPLANLGILLAGSGQPQEAIGFLSQAVTLEPGAFRARTHLGNQLAALQRLPEAEAAYAAALQHKPDHPPALVGHARTLLDLGRAQEALDRLDRVLALASASASAELHRMRGLCLDRLGDTDKAEAAYHQALALQPDLAVAHLDLAISLSNRGRPEEALAQAERASALDPRLVEAHLTLGLLRVKLGDVSDGIASYQQALALRPQQPAALNNLVLALQLKGQVPQAVAAQRRAIAEWNSVRSEHTSVPSGLAMPHSALLMMQHYDLTDGAQALAQEHRDFGARHFPTVPPPPRAPAKKAVLRVGYVSADLHDHSVARFIEPIFSAFDRAAFETIVYSDCVAPDAVTGRLRGLATRWHDVHGLPEADLAERIRRDEIDILVDLGGHSADNRLAVFACKPAPVQATYLGYPNSTGLATMDYRITDALSDPPGTADPLYVEKLVRLPGSAWCYAAGETVALAFCPSEMKGHVTFGCFNHFAKVRPPLLARWAEILRAVPGSHLLLKARGFTDQALQREVRAVFAGHGITEDRIELRSWARDRARHLQLYGSVDISLDTFPYHGTTTTCDSLWMGVPVVTLAGESHVSLVGVSLLHSAGLPDLVAYTPDEYVAIAVRLAGDRARLSALRRTLRDQIRASHLGDAAAFTRALEDAYRDMWSRAIR